MVILISAKTDFVSKTVKRDRTLYTDKRVNSPRRYNKKIYTLDNRAPKYMKQTLTEFKEGRNKNSSRITFGDFHCPLLIESTARQKFSKDTEDFSKTINQLTLTDIYRTLHPIKAKYTFFSRCTWNIL